METFDRVKLLIGGENYLKLKNSKVAVFGVGGVGGYVVEALVRSGVENITIFDNDVVAKSNLNRQIIATLDNLGKDKVEVLKERALSINKNAKIQVEKVFYLPESADNYDLSGYDYVVDAVDTVTAKIEIIKRCKGAGVKVISCMGTGGKLNPLELKVCDIEKTSVCPLARVMRRELKKRDISDVLVVYSTEEPKGEKREKTPPSMIFVPASAGLLIAKTVVEDLISR